MRGGQEGHKEAQELVGKSKAEGRGSRYKIGISKDQGR